MAEKIDAAGLPERCVTHGLRKAAARRLAEAGCSPNEIAAITGHATLAEVARYTRAAEQRRLAEAAMERLAGSLIEAGSQTSGEGLGDMMKKAMISKVTLEGSQNPRVWKRRCGALSRRTVFRGLRASALTPRCRAGTA